MARVPTLAAAFVLLIGNSVAYQEGARVDEALSAEGMIDLEELGAEIDEDEADEDSDVEEDRDEEIGNPEEDDGGNDDEDEDEDETDHDEDEDDIEDKNDFDVLPDDAGSRYERRHPLNDPLHDNAKATGDKGSCAALKNHGTHFSVKVTVGTPMNGTAPQEFNVVADTGSNTLIIPSCVCVQNGFCDLTDGCFTGMGKSSSFLLRKMKVPAPGGNGTFHQGAPTVQLSFGSGNIQAVIAQDVATVGGLSATMKNSVLLMVGKELSMAGHFSGILGLGLPKDVRADGATGRVSYSKHASNGPELDVHQKPATKHLKKKSSSQDAFQALSSMQADETKPARRILGEPTIMNVRSGTEAEWTSVDAKVTHEVAAGKQVKMKGFLEEAGVDRFSMCFNDGQAGVLRLNTPERPKPLLSVGHMHWGLDFQGVSVGKETTPVTFCDPKDKKPGQETVCGGIPDSGTTVIMAPKEHLMKLFSQICKDWSRCKEAASKVKGMKPGMEFQVFFKLLVDCHTWMGKDGLGELPSIFFHVAGKDGNKQTLELPGKGYILEMSRNKVKYAVEKIFGDAAILGKTTGESMKVCSPAFGASNYITQENGPVWIIGTPLFYAYRVEYDLNKKMPSISFSKEKCGSCDSESGKASLLSDDEEEEGALQNRPRFIDEPYRINAFDFSQGL